ncbi:transcription initiation factor TFIID subunit 3-like [Pecten maximus]|uniref:transcription initiation factor TFIID subunit 3-like n=1 Tax=Pecten maximus TaxID=6579 RepID=UPI00145862A4|nr:transcription initiation factor TFIID subunit 3-like [Pecten maximus]
MANEYCRSMLRVSLAQICQNLGWNAAQATPLELLTDVLERYLLEVAKVTHRYSEQFGRTDPNLDDLGLAFGHLGIQLGELEDYVHHVDPLPFAHEVVSFPVPKRNNFQFPRSDSREVLQRDEHIPDHLPAMFPEEIEPPQSPPHTKPESGMLAPPPTTPMAASPSDIQVDGAAVSPGLSDKRLLTSPPSGGPPSKRIRLTTLPEEAAHSQYEMKSMAMNVAGEVMPTGGYIGKLPDAKTPPQGFPKRFPKDNTRGSSSKSAPLVSVARDILSELNSKKDTNEGSQKKDKDKNYSNSLSKKSGIKKRSNNSSEKKDVSKTKSKVKKSLLTPKPRSRSRSKSPARAKSPKGAGNKKGQNKIPSDSGAGLFSETIMLERQKGPVSDKGRSSSPIIKNKDESHNIAVTSHKNRDSPRSTPLDLSCKKVSKPSDLEEKKRRLDAIESSIDSVLRKSALSLTENELDISDSTFVPLEMEEENIEGSKAVEKAKVEGSKPVEKIKEVSTSSSIDDTINAVIGAVDRTDTPATPVSVKEEAVDQSTITPTPALQTSPIVTTPVLTSQTSPRKKGRPPKKGKSKGNKKPSTPPVAPPVTAEPPPVVEPRSPKDEKFAVFDFPESPPMRSTPKPVIAPSVPPPPVIAPRSPSPPPPVEQPAPVVVEEPLAPVMEESLVKVKVEETAQVTPTPEKSHNKEKEKHKSKEHKKEKKEKKKDKEKKKKNKDKDRDKERSKHKDKSTKSPGTFPAGLTKLKIRLGSSPFSSTVTYSSEAKDRSPSGSPAQRPEIPKLVIKPMPPLPASQDRGSDSPKTSTSNSKSSKKDNKSKKDAGHIVVKKEAVSEKLPSTPPAVTRTPSPAPVAKTPSPVKKTPSPVPIKREPSPVPPPKPVTPVPPPKPVTPVPPPKSVITVPKFIGSESPDRSSRDGPPVLKMEMMEEPPVLTPQPSPHHKTPTPPPPRNPTPPKPKPAPSPIPSPKHSPSPMPVYSPSPPRVNSPPPSAFTSKSMSSSPVKTPSPSRTRTPSPIPSLPPSPIHQPSPSPTPTKPPTPSPTPTPAHSPSPGPLIIKEAPAIPPMPPPSIGTASQASATAKTALQRTVTSETIGSFIDASSGEKIWICPACKRQDDGSPMVGCDICDDWYHWECIGINKEPEEDSWYCNKCLAPTRKPSKRGRGGGRGRGRGRGRKKSLKE